MGRRYGFWAFIFDCVMTSITCGFWLIYVYVREQRVRNPYIR